MCSPLSSLWKCFWDIIFMTCTYMGSFTLTANVYFGVKSPTACLCEFLIYVSFFKSTLKTQASKNSQMHKAIPFTKLLYSLLKSVGGGWCFLFLLEWEKQNCDTNRSWALQSIAQWLLKREALKTDTTILSCKQRNEDLPV